MNASCNSVVSTVASADENGDLNILLIAVDDLRPELGCYGLSHVQSPSLDRFAKSSVVFTNHFVQVPTCGASRYALLTGRSPLHSGALGNQAFYQGRTQLDAQELEAAQTFPELFRRSGYRTVCIGKISHTPDGRAFAYDGSGDGHAELPNAWDELATPFGNWNRGWGSFFAYEGGRHREDGKGNSDLMEFVARSDDELPDGMMATTAIGKLGELKRQRDESGQPFLLGLGFFKPHLPFVATQSDWDAFEGIDIPLPDNADKPDSIGWHRSGEFYKYRMPFEKKRPLDPVAQRHARRAYLACVRYVDRQIGRVLNSLDELDLADNTIVIVWGDHGWHLGESEIWGKHSPFDRSLRSVLMVRAPGISVAGHQCDELVESLDLYPTLVDLCQPEFNRTAHPLNGQSLRGLLEGGSDPVRVVATSWFKGSVTVRSKTHRLIHPSGSGADRNIPTELYNLSSSPDPIANVAAIETEVLAELIEQIPVK